MTQVQFNNVRLNFSRIFCLIGSSKIYMPSVDIKPLQKYVISKSNNSTTVSVIDHETVIRASVTIRRMQ